MHLKELHHILDVVKQDGLYVSFTGTRFQTPAAAITTTAAAEAIYRLIIALRVQTMMEAMAFGAPGQDVDEVSRAAFALLNERCQPAMDLWSTKGEDDPDTSGPVDSTGSPVQSTDPLN
jgi:hypothetical protein